jgi:hypothetical protein
MQWGGYFSLWDRVILQNVFLVDFLNNLRFYYSKQLLLAGCMCMSVSLNKNVFFSQTKQCRHYTPRLQVWSQFPLEREHVKFQRRPRPIVCKMPRPCMPVCEWRHMKIC